jgi:hypothetical protein
MHMLVPPAVIQALAIATKNDMAERHGRSGPDKGEPAPEDSGDYTAVNFNRSFHKPHSTTGQLSGQDEKERESRDRRSPEIAKASSDEKVSLRVALPKEWR